MLDPYLYPGTSILQNKLDIRDQDILNAAESDYTTLRLGEIHEKPLSGGYDFKHLCAVHRYVFQDIYEWAGKPRTLCIIKYESVLAGLSVDYAKPEEIQKEGEAVLRGMRAEPWKQMTLELRAERFSKHLAALWKVHPFREGNTRTVTFFCCQYAEKNGMPIDRGLFAKHNAYFRDALVAANAIFGDLGDKSKPEYLQRIVYDAMERAGNRQRK